MSIHSKIGQWKDEIERITNDFTDTIEARHILSRLREIITANPKINTDNLFWDHLTASFGASMVLGIARQVDERTEVISLLKLLNDIRSNASIITREWFADQYKPTLPREIGEQHFAENFGQMAELDTAIVEKDIQDLNQATAKVKKFRHTRIAHKNADERLVIDLNFEEVDKAIEVIERIVIKYQLLLNQSGMPQLMPVIQYDWEAIFREPWLKE